MIILMTQITIVGLIPSPFLGGNRIQFTLRNSRQRNETSLITLHVKSIYIGNTNKKY